MDGVWTTNVQGKETQCPKQTAIDHSKRFVTDCDTDAEHFGTENSEGDGSQKNGQHITPAQEKGNAAGKDCTQSTTDELVNRLENDLKRLETVDCGGSDDLSDTFKSNLEGFLLQSVDDDELLNRLPVQDIPDEAVLRLCNGFLTAHTSYTVSVSFLKGVLLPRIVACTKSVSPSIRKALHLCASSHPRAVVGGVLLPLFTSNPTTSHIEAVNRAVKSNFDPGAMEHAVRTLCSESVNSSWGCGHFAILQSALESPLPLMPELVNKVVIALGEAAREHGSNVKFCKVVLTVVQKYGASSAGLEHRLLALAKKTNTFLSKAIISQVELLKARPKDSQL